MTSVDTRATVPDQLATGTDLLRVDNLRVAFGDTEVVSGISFTARPGACLAVVGESGSGKSVTARTLVGLTGNRARVTADRIDLAGVCGRVAPPR